MNTSTTRILQKMDQELESLIQELSQFSNEQLNQQPKGGGWSVIQIMHHLIIAEEGSLKYVKKKLSFNPELKNTGFAEGYRSLILNLYLWAPFKFKAPAAVGDDKLPIEANFQKTAQRWKDNRKDLKDYLNSLPEDLFNKSIYKHPLAGRLSFKGMLQFFDGHFNRHRKQIKRTLAS